MGLLNVIRTLRLRHGLAIREIARRTGLSRIEAIGRHWFKTNG
jgi:transcriptional regulator with XRE-family HTH domain